MKKKKPAPAAQQTPEPPAKEASAPQPEPAPASTAAAGPQPAPAAGGKDVSAVPVEGPAAAPKPAEAAAPAPEDATSPTPPVTVPIDPIDWFAMRQPFLNRGVFLNDRDGDQIENNWMYFYGNMVRLGFGPDLSTKIANFQTPIYYDLALRADGNLTQIERFNLETEKMLPPGQSLGMITVPVLTPDSLNFMVKQVSGKDINFRF